MRAIDLISKLEELVVEYGDCSVVLFNQDDCSVEDVDNAYYDDYYKDFIVE